MNILDLFQHITPTEDQKNAMLAIEQFTQSDNDVFILKGYAGSGKTTMLKMIVNYLNANNKKYQLMAPTGRAAKVIYQNTEQHATTIHKGIYSFNKLDDLQPDKNNQGTSFKYYYALRNNQDIYNTVFIVDEASMVSDVYSENEFFHFGSGYLLKDLINFTRVNQGDYNTKILFVGDPAQLPPVGMNFSPALDNEYLNRTYGIKVTSSEMKEVKRHQADNGILKSATQIRQSLTSGYFNHFDLTENKRDIFNPQFDEFLATYENAASPKIIITYKNKTALDLNQRVRQNKWGKELPISNGDLIIIGANNYNFDVLNGEFGVVTYTDNNTIERRITFNYANSEKKTVRLKWRFVKLLIPDETGSDNSVSGYILENYLHSNATMLSQEEKQALFVDFKYRHPKLKPRTEEFKEALQNDLYFNAIMLKFGYAVTCHKAQGGEWKNAFVFWDTDNSSEFDFYTTRQSSSGKTNQSFYRWSYTAITRAKNQLFCINPPYFSSFSKATFVDKEIQNSMEELTGRETSPEEIHFDEEKASALQKFGLENTHLNIQDHFINLKHYLDKRMIDITGWQRKGYEIWYSFSRQEKTAGIKFWVNKNNKFKPKFQKLPPKTNADDFYEEISQLLEKMPNFIIKRNTVDSVVSKLEFGDEVEEKKPFLKVLFETLKNRCEEKNIKIQDLEHYEYRERYSFSRNSENTVIDFEYDKKGFLGRVIPLVKKCNSKALLDDMKHITEAIKTDNYVIQTS